MQAIGGCRPDTFRTSGWYLNPKCYEECSGSSPWTEHDDPRSSVGSVCIKESLGVRDSPKNCPRTSKHQCQEVWDSQLVKIFSHLEQKFRINLCYLA